MRFLRYRLSLKLETLQHVEQRAVLGLAGEYLRAGFKQTPEHTVEFIVACFARDICRAPAFA